MDFLEYMKTSSIKYVCLKQVYLNRSNNVIHFNVGDFIYVDDNIIMDSKGNLIDVDSFYLNIHKFNRL